MGHVFQVQLFNWRAARSETIQVTCQAGGRAGDVRIGSLALNLSRNDAAPGGDKVAKTIGCW